MQKSAHTIDWKSLLRILLKAGLLFILLNLIFALLVPMDWIGSLSLYNWFLPGRERLPYGENSSESYNLSLYNIPAMMASHEVAQEKSLDEFRVIIIGDSGTWGWYLENKDTLAGKINAGNYLTADGKVIRAYNLGYPVMSLTKDLMILEAALKFHPDLIVWPVTLESFPINKQLFSPIVQNNPQRVRALIEKYNLNINPNDSRFQEQQFFDQTIIGQRRNLADLLRLQLYGFSWLATGIDQAIPDEIPLRQSDFEQDVSWQDFSEEVTLTEDDLALEVLAAGVKLAGGVPLLIINEPMFVSSGENSDLRYNSFYPRWAYDQYRKILNASADNQQWLFWDLWDLVDPEEFTDTPVHLTPEGIQLTAERITQEILQIANNQVKPVD